MTDRLYWQRIYCGLKLVETRNNLIPYSKIVTKVI